MVLVWVRMHCSPILSVSYQSTQAAGMQPKHMITIRAHSSVRDRDLTSLSQNAMKSLSPAYLFLTYTIWKSSATDCIPM